MPYAGARAGTERSGLAPVGRGVVEVRGLSKAFGTFTALDAVDLQVRRGEFLTLLGPSGCGKTTLLRLIAGFETPTGGSVHVDGEDMTARPPYRRPFGMMFQSLALFPHLSVGDNVGFGLKVRRVPGRERRERVGAALDLVGLGHLAGRGVHQLSGGQRQRVALARALAVRPTVLLLDEPLSALDLKLRRQLQVELKQIQTRVQTTFVMVTHDQEEALSISDRIAVMDAGRIEQLGSAKEIYDVPRTLFVAGFVGESNVFEVAVTGREGGLDLHVPALGLSRRVERRPADIPPDPVLVVRPEDIALAPAAPGHDSGGGRAVGTVVGETYSGDGFRYSVDLGGRTVLATRPARVGEPAPFARGDRVAVDWRGACATLVPGAGRKGRGPTDA